MSTASPPRDDDGITFVDRASGQVQRETVYGGAGVRWCYGTRLGLLLSRAVLAARWPSQLYGRYLDSRRSRRKIAHFIETLGIDPDECTLPLSEYTSFNQFFTRELKPAARPLDPEPDTLLSPGDGRLWAVSGVDGDTVVPIKGAPFSIGQLLDDTALAERFAGGDCVCLRLCPADYHRTHFPAAGVPGTPRRIRGRLHSVNPWALATGLPIFASNEREVALLDSERFGQIAIIDVGAMFVGRIVQTYTPGEPCLRGQEKGYFAFGGSTTIVLLEPGRVALDADLTDATRRGLETRVLMGTRIGRITESAG